MRVLVCDRRWPATILGSRICQLFTADCFCCRVPGLMRSTHFANSPTAPYGYLCLRLFGRLQCSRAWRSMRDGTFDMPFCLACSIRPRTRGEWISSGLKTHGEQLGPFEDSLSLMLSFKFSSLGFRYRLLQRTLQYIGDTVNLTTRAEKFPWTNIDPMTSLPLVDVAVFCYLPDIKPFANSNPPLTPNSIILLCQTRR